jgi:hypothetical protein
LQNLFHRKAKTYLEKHFADFETSDIDALIKHGLEAMCHGKSLDQGHIFGIPMVGV